MYIIGKIWPDNELQYVMPKTEPGRAAPDRAATARLFPTQTRHSQKFPPRIRFDLALGISNAPNFPPALWLWDMFQHNLNWSHSMMMQVSDLLPGLPPLSIVTVVGMSMVGATVLLYLLSRIRELLFIAGISLLYAAVPLLPMLKHL